MFVTEPWQPCGSSLGKNCRQRNCSARAANRSLGMAVRKGDTGMGGQGEGWGRKLEKGGDRATWWEAGASRRRFSFEISPEQGSQRTSQSCSVSQSVSSCLPPTLLCSHILITVGFIFTQYSFPMDRHSRPCK